MIPTDVKVLCSTESLRKAIGKMFYGSVMVYDGNVLSESVTCLVMREVGLVLGPNDEELGSYYMVYYEDTYTNDPAQAIEFGVGPVGRFCGTPKDNEEYSRVHQDPEVESSDKHYAGKAGRAFPLKFKTGAGGGTGRVSSEKPSVANTGKTENLPQDSFPLTLITKDIRNKTCGYAECFVTVGNTEVAALALQAGPAKKIVPKEQAVGWLFLAGLTPHEAKDFLEEATAAWAEKEEREKEDPEYIWIVVQQGGSSSEFYASSYNSENLAKAAMEGHARATYASIGPYKVKNPKDKLGEQLLLQTAESAARDSVTL